MTENSLDNNSEIKLKPKNKNVQNYPKVISDIYYQNNLAQTINKNDSSRVIINNNTHELAIIKNNCSKPKTFDKKIQRNKTSGIFNLNEMNQFFKLGKSDLENYKSSKVKIKNCNQNKPKFKFSKISLKININNFLDHNVTALIFTLSTIYVLIIIDLNIIFFPPKMDIVFTIFYNIIFFSFLLEFALYLIIKEEYKCTYFFWLDLACIISIFINIGWIIYPIIEFFSNLNSKYHKHNYIIQNVIENLSVAIKGTR